MNPAKCRLRKYRELKMWAGQLGKKERLKKATSRYCSIESNVHLQDYTLCSISRMLADCHRERGTGAFLWRQLLE